MKNFIPKIIITQLPGTNKLGFENEDGELRLLIENDFSEEEAEDQPENIFK